MDFVDYSIISLSDSVCESTSGKLFYSAWPRIKREHLNCFNYLKGFASLFDIRFRSFLVEGRHSILYDAIFFEFF